jgi:hypothetical protein
MTQRAITFAFAALLAMFAGIFLLWDATTFAFYAPDLAAGRPAGCFTAVELLLGVSRPSAVRGIELLGAPFLIFGGPADAFRAFVRWTRTPSRSAPAV